LVLFIITTIGIAMIMIAARLMGSCAAGNIMVVMVMRNNLVANHSEND
jgi:hypothetical protein